PTDSPHYSFILEQYDKNQLGTQKCSMKDASDEKVDTRMGTPFVDLATVTKDDEMQGKLWIAGLSTVSAFYRNLPAATRVPVLKADSGCKAGAVRHHLVVAEPAFPARLHCETCTSSNGEHPTE
ncbi:hypothetical protein PENTCL1PPCAC_841, partial [Pristionchus entomophagus]